MHPDVHRKWFSDLLHESLVSLYDPRVLHRSSLVRLFGLEGRREIASSLRQTLCAAIETLQPNAHTPRDSKLWRTYHILRRRYIEQVMQREVAMDLGLSIRQLQRDETQARETLADYLWDAFDLALKAPHVATISSTAEPTPEHELEHLKEFAPEYITDVDGFIREALDTVQPLFAARGANVTYSAPDSVCSIYVPAPILRQALINLLGAALHCTPNPQVEMLVEAQVILDRLTLDIRAQGSTVDPTECLDSLEMAQHLIGMCGGQVQIDFAPERQNFYTVSMSLPVEAPAAVLVIDDNADTRQLLQRFLTGTRYRFIGAADWQQGLKLAVEQRPSVIMLDVMMPGQDGWAMLGRLREHPTTEQIPVVICTILAQENLALALGAAEFMRKPISRDRLLTMLDRQSRQLARG